MGYDDDNCGGIGLPELTNHKNGVSSANRVYPLIADNSSLYISQRKTGQLQNSQSQMLKKKHSHWRAPHAGTHEPCC